ncbi:MAG: helix-turn-helix transcriptional regulator [Ruminococcus sp.]|nr:helix-turn-helix transcriptional regulator [Ruminococcus sp.]
MTFSEKLRKARNNAGLSQEQLAEKLCVSRQAVTKWETGKGMPDIENIRAISALLNVSIDELLSPEEGAMNVLREHIDLSDYKPKGSERSTKDACAGAKFPVAEHIWALFRRKKLSKKE